MMRFASIIHAHSILQIIQQNDILMVIYLTLRMFYRTF